MHRGGVHGRGACVVGACMCGRRDVHGRGHVWQGGMHGRGHAWQGMCMARGMHCRGACVAEEKATAADGTHPTGMISCLQEVKTANEARAALSPFKNHSLTMLQSTPQMAAAAELLDHVIPLAWVDQQVQAGSPSYLLLDCLQKNFFA